MDIYGRNVIQTWRSSRKTFGGSGETFVGSGPARASSGRLLGRHMAREPGDRELFSPLGRYYKDFQAQAGGPELPKININYVQNRDPFLDPLRNRPERDITRFLL